MNNTIFVGVVIGLFAIMVAPLVMTEVNASIVGHVYNTNPTKFVNPNIVIGHINEAQSAMQNGDTEAANNHLELAKQSLQGNQSNSGQ